MSIGTVVKTAQAVAEVAIEASKVIKGIKEAVSASKEVVSASKEVVSESKELVSESKGFVNSLHSEHKSSKEILFDGKAKIPEEQTNEKILEKGDVSQTSLPNIESNNNGIEDEDKWTKNVVWGDGVPNKGEMIEGRTDIKLNGDFVCPDNPFIENIPPSSTREIDVRDDTLLKYDVNGMESNSSAVKTVESSNDHGGVDITKKEDSPRKIKTINDSLEGKTHPDTGVPYERKVVETDTGEKVDGVFPQFESALDVQLPEDLEQASDKKQFDECNKQLKEKCKSDPEFRSKFTPDQLADIEDGYTPEGYTWHHNEEKGKMQLVDSDTHWNTRHTGGRNIWGGGSENRR